MTEQEPKKICFNLPDCQKDIQMMSVWIECFNHFKNEITEKDARSALNWFKSRMSKELTDMKNNHTTWSES